MEQYPLSLSDLLSGMADKPEQIFARRHKCLANRILVKFFLLSF